MRPVIVGEKRTGFIVPVNEAGEVGDIDFTKPWEYRISGDPAVVSAAAVAGDPKRFEFTAKQAGKSFAIIFQGVNLFGDVIISNSDPITALLPPVRVTKVKFTIND